MKSRNGQLVNEEIKEFRGMVSYRMLDNERLVFCMESSFDLCLLYYSVEGYKRDGLP